jgi:hypothetical protein
LKTSKSLVVGRRGEGPGKPEALEQPRTTPDSPKVKLIIKFARRQPGGEREEKPE